MIGLAVTREIKRQFDDMPLQMRMAARFVAAHPKDVALLSMREVAKRADVPPATMTRLAKRLGFAGYEALRAVYADDVRGGTDWFSERAPGMLSRREEVGEAGLVGDYAAALAGYMKAFAEPQMLARFSAAADLLMAAERICCIGARSAYPVAHLFSYVQSYFRPNATVVGVPGGAEPDVVIDMGPRDAVLAVSFEPYARSTVAAVRTAAEAGARIVAITDSELVGIGKRSDVAILTPKRAPSFFDTLTPAVAAAEILCAMLASRVGPDVTRRVRDRERKLAAMGIWEGRGPAAA